MPVYTTHNTLNPEATITTLYGINRAAHGAYQAACDAATAKGVSILDDLACRHLSSLCDVVSLAADLAAMVRDDAAEAGA
jgi:hypothetical protein